MVWRWKAAHTAKWENDYTGRKKEQNQSGSGSFSAVPEEPGNFLVLLPRWLEAQPTWCSGQQLGLIGGGRVEDDGWDVGQEERAESWWVRVMQFKYKQRALQTALTEPLNHWTSLWSVSSLHDASQTVTQLPQLLTASRSLMTEYFVVKTCVFEHYLLWGNALILYWSWIFMSFFFLRNIIFNPSVHRFWSRQSRNLSENEWQRFVEHVVCAN